MKRWQRFFWVLVVGLPCFSALAYVDRYNAYAQPLQWNLTNPPVSVPTNSFSRSTKAIRFYIGAEAFSTSNTTAEINAIKAALGQWQAIPNTLIKFEFAGLLSNITNVNPSDGTNVIFWKKDTSLLNGTTDISQSLGICFYSYSSNTITEADIALNGINKSWFTDITDAANTNYFVEGVVMHEMGHGLGMAHSPIGGQIMFPTMGRGIQGQIRLLSDEIAFARSFYAATNPAANYGCLTGYVTLAGSGVKGAIVTVESTNGSVLASTLTWSNGYYAVPLLPPGPAWLRVTPMDGFGLVNPAMLNEPFFTSSPQTNFYPSTNYSVTLTAGVTNGFNISVTNGAPPFRIQYIRYNYSYGGGAISVNPGDNNVIVGVMSTNLPTNGAVLQILGDGLTIGPTVIEPNLAGPLNSISVTISVATNATPGVRSLIILRTNDNVLAHAVGFLQIPPAIPDQNFDGLNDLFQRKYFPVFTDPQAGPNADPDNDGLNNLQEYIAGTNPTNKASVLSVLSTTISASGTTIKWQSVAGKKYQLFSRPGPSPAGNWTPLGTPVTATNAGAQYFDAGAPTGRKFYRIQVLP
ncbi:MAG: matrixin family metalloprotease [Verrucomicrobiota bacterium]